MCRNFPLKPTLFTKSLQICRNYRDPDAKPEHRPQKACTFASIPTFERSTDENGCTFAGNL
jgi:hypothetical protein